MAITLKQSPALLQPAYNPIMVSMTSDNDTQNGFQFIVDIFSASTAHRIQRYKFPANPQGFGVKDIHRTLENYVSYDLDDSLTATGVTSSNGSFFKYDLQFGEEYKFTWTFDDNFAGSTGAGFTASTQHYFAVGDRINITQDAGYTHEEYNGTHVITAVPDNYAIEIDVSFKGSTPAEGGGAIYSNQKKTIFSGLTAISGLTVNNGALSHLDYIDYDVDNYNLTGGTSGLLWTDMPANYKFRTTNRAWVNYYASSGNTVRKVIVRAYDAAGNVEGTFYTNTNSPINYRHFGVGPWNMTWWAMATSGSSSLPIIKTTTKSYDIQLYDNSEVPLSELLTFEIDDTCTMFDNIELVFQDRKGNFTTANFQLARKESINIEKDEYKKPFGSVNSSGVYSYDSKSRGRTVYDVTETKQFEANSNWVTETTADYLRQLFTSPEVYWNDNGTFKPVIITNSFYKIPKQQTDKLFNVTVNFELGYRDAIQRG